MDEDNRPPCGKSDCYCDGMGPEHADCACGCDCPRCIHCRYDEENCEC